MKGMFVCPSVHPSIPLHHLDGLMDFDETLYEVELSPESMANPVGNSIQGIGHPFGYFVKLVQKFGKS